MFIQLVVMNLLLPRKSFIEHDLSKCSVYFHAKVCQALRGRQEMQRKKIAKKERRF